MECPACGETSPEGATWCEACGHDLNAEPLPECQACGEREVTDEGYCGICGHKQPEERDHMEFGEDALIAVTNKGKRHRHNEDSVAVGHAFDEAGNVTAAALVVCDGVSSTPGSAEASEAATKAALNVLLSGLSDPVFLANRTNRTQSESGDGSKSDLDVLIESATVAAQNVAAAAPEVESNHPGSSGGPPSSTFVAVVSEPDANGANITVGWLGDSRAYWLGDEALLLTSDHEVEGSLTRWIGADSPNPTPDLASHRFEGLGYLVVCTDGLWRYASAAQELKELVQRLVDQGAAGTTLGSQLIDFANDNGGHDNITAAVWTNHPQPPSVIESRIDLDQHATPEEPTAVGVELAGDDLPEEKSDPE